jgi:CheY-like chemotaxis protein
MKTVLVIDDEREISELLRAVLEEEGYQVVIAADGQAGLDLVRQSRPDMILSDVMMPRLDGRTLSRILQTHPSYHTIPIALMSAGPAPPESNTYAVFVSKPFLLDAVVDIVRRLIGDASTADPG